MNQWSSQNQQIIPLHESVQQKKSRTKAQKGTNKMQRNDAQFIQTRLRLVRVLRMSKISSGVIPDLIFAI